VGAFEVRLLPAPMVLTVQSRLNYRLRVPFHTWMSLLSVVWGQLLLIMHVGLLFHYTAQPVNTNSNSTHTALLYFNVGRTT